MSRAAILAGNEGLEVIAVSTTSPKNKSLTMSSFRVEKVPAVKMSHGRCRKKGDRAFVFLEDDKFSPWEK